MIQTVQQFNPSVNSYVTTDEFLFQFQEYCLLNLTEEEKDSLHAYQGLFSKSINALLRGYCSKEVQYLPPEKQLRHYINHLDSALKKSTLPSKLIVYRDLGERVSQWSALQMIGTHVIDWGFTSACLTPGKALSFSSRSQSSATMATILKIVLPSRVPAFYLDLLDDLDEQELLIARGGIYRVTDLEILPDDNRCLIELVYCTHFDNQVVIKHSEKVLKSPSLFKEGLFVD